MVWRNRFFREIRQIYLFSSRAIYRRARGTGGRVRKNSPDGHKAPIVVPGGLPPLSPAGTGRQLRARAKDEPGGYLFSFCRQTHRVWSIRMAICFETTQKKRGEGEARKRFISSHCGTWPSYRNQETSRRRSPQRFDRSTDAIKI